jgi:hypothetical protein
MEKRLLPTTRLAVFDLIHEHWHYAGPSCAPSTCLCLTARTCVAFGLRNASARQRGFLVASIAAMTQSSTSTPVRSAARALCPSDTYGVPRRSIAALSQDQEAGRASGAATRRRRLERLILRKRGEGEDSFIPLHRHYYRSRFEEELLNHHAEHAGLDWIAPLRGHALERGVRNIGPIPPFGHNSRRRSLPTAMHCRRLGRR